MINGREETIYGNEKEFSNRNEEKKFTFSNWEEKRKAEREISASKRTAHLKQMNLHGRLQTKKKPCTKTIPKWWRLIKRKRG